MQTSNPEDVTREREKEGEKEKYLYRCCGAKLRAR
jgi:hypothetical protein